MCVIPVIKNFRQEIVSSFSIYKYGKSSTCFQKSENPSLASNKVFPENHFLASFFNHTRSQSQCNKSGTKNCSRAQNRQDLFPEVVKQKGKVFFGNNKFPEEFFLGNKNLFVSFYNIIFGKSSGIYGKGLSINIQRWSIHKLKTRGIKKEKPSKIRQIIHEIRDNQIEPFIKKSELCFRIS